MTSNLDTSACLVAQPCAAGHKEALGFIVALQNTNRNTITEQTPDEEFQMTQIGGPNKHHTKEG
jgi:hypothetical protein